MPSQIEIIFLGLLLGVRHAFDADHLVAVTTIVSSYKNPLKAAWIGISWGLGHTLTLFLAGVLLLLLNIRITGNAAQFFEFIVGAMLVVLGIQTLWSFRRRKVHVHVHTHESTEHKHFHVHEETPGHAHAHLNKQEQISRKIAEDIIPGEHRDVSGQRPFRVKSFLVGIVHGLAGSAALMLLVLAEVSSKWVGISYILLFGFGTAASMAIISILISLPFSISAKIPALNKIIQTGAGALSIVFGLVWMFQAFNIIGKE